jgi:hypothetical protein
MKKLVFIAIIFIFTFAHQAYALDKTVTFAWDPHDQIDIIKNFELHWANQQGGPYGQLAVIAKADAIDNEEPIQATVTGNPATTVIRYFVLKACGDLPQEDGSTLYECSGPSNEISVDFWIPAEAYKVPVNFRIVPES